MASTAMRIVLIRRGTAQAPPSGRPSCHAHDGIAMMPADTLAISRRCIRLSGTHSNVATQVGAPSWAATIAVQFQHALFTLRPYLVAGVEQRETDSHDAAHTAAMPFPQSLVTVPVGWPSPEQRCANGVITARTINTCCAPHRHRRGSSRVGTHADSADAPIAVTLSVRPFSEAIEHLVVRRLLLAFTDVLSCPSSAASQQRFCLCRTRLDTQLRGQNGRRAERRRHSEDYHAHGGACTAKRRAHKVAAQTPLASRTARMQAACVVPRSLPLAVRALKKLQLRELSAFDVAQLGSMQARSEPLAGAHAQTRRDERRTLCQDPLREYRSAYRTTACLLFS